MTVCVVSGLLVLCVELLLSVLDSSWPEVASE